jgi:pimeloyl-ACP methyl ester carboxylesterase
MTRHVVPFIVIGLALSIAATTAFAQGVAFGPPRSRDARFVTDPAGDGQLETIEYFVPHVSTVPATAGEEVMLFVRERVTVHGRGERPAVLMVTGATTSAIPVFDLEFQEYSWMTHLANAGFDVFAMDLTGYGFSPRPFMDDPCNASTAQQQAFLIPNPLSETCPPSFERLLTSPDSDRDEIDTVVDFIRELRGLDRVHLVGWSRGGARVGSYAAIHPEKVDRLVLFAPNYGQSAPDAPPADLPLPGFALDVQGSAAFWGFWDADVKCEDQFDPQIRDHIRDSMLAFDPLGAEWGDAGVRRAPGLHGRATQFWGWNRSFAGRVEAETLLVRGNLDTLVGPSQTDPLNEDLQSPHLYLQIDCGSHFLAWERQHDILLRASSEWLRHGSFEGFASGTVHVDTEGAATAR